MRAFARMWDRICAERYGVTDPRARRFRYGVQVNSLGLTESQPENNVQRVVLEMLGVTLSKEARARSIQLPAWNEALGLPRPWDQQWALRMQQVLAYETDLLEYDDIFEGSHVIEARTAELMEAAQVELDGIIDDGGAFANIASLKSRLVQSHADRVRAIEVGEVTVVGRNHFTESEPSALLNSEATIERVDPAVEKALIADLEAWRADRDGSAVYESLDALRAAAESDGNLMDASIACARVGATTGEWADALRSVFGEYQGPTGVGTADIGGFGPLRVLAERHREMPDGPPRILVAKPGLDGHSNGAEQIAVAARDAGMEVIYQGIRRTPEQIASSARDEDVDLIGLSILSGSHLELVPAVIDRLRAEGVSVPVVVGGIIPPEDYQAMEAMGVARVYTPKNFQLAAMVADMSELVRAHRLASAD